MMCPPAILYFVIKYAESCKNATVELLRFLLRWNGAQEKPVENYIVAPLLQCYPALAVDSSDNPRL